MPGTSSADELVTMLNRGDSLDNVIDAARSSDDLADALRRVGRGGEVTSAQNAFNVRTGTGQLSTTSGSGGGAPSSLFDSARADTGAPSLTGGRDRSGLTPPDSQPPPKTSVGDEPEIPPRTGDGATQSKQTKDALDDPSRSQTKKKAEEESKTAEGREESEPPPKNDDEATSLWQKVSVGLPTLMGLVTAAMLIYGISLYFKKTKTTFNITKIENDSEGLLGTTKLIKITYNPDCTINVRDTVTLSSTNSDPVIDGTHAVVKYYSDTQIGIEAKETLKSDGSSGTMKVESSLVRTITSTFGAAARDVITPVADAAGDTVGDLFSGVFWWIIAFVVIIIIAVIAMSFMK